jgi:hypothetical protein
MEKEPPHPNELRKPLEESQMDSRMWTPSRLWWPDGIEHS